MSNFNLQVISLLDDQKRPLGTARSPSYQAEQARLKRQWEARRGRTHAPPPRGLYDHQRRTQTLQQAIMADAKHTRGTRPLAMIDEFPELYELKAALDVPLGKHTQRQLAALWDARRYRRRLMCADCFVPYSPPPDPPTS